MRVIDLPWKPYGSGWIASVPGMTAVYTVTKPLEGYGCGGWIAHSAFDMPPSVHPSIEAGKQACQDHFQLKVAALVR